MKIEPHEGISPLIKYSLHMRLNVSTYNCPCSFCDRDEFNIWITLGSGRAILLYKLLISILLKLLKDGLLADLHISLRMFRFMSFLTWMPWLGCLQIRSRSFFHWLGLYCGGDMIGLLRGACQNRWQLHFLLFLFFTLLICFLTNSGHGCSRLAIFRM